MKIVHQPSVEPLTRSDPMPFGKHAGTPMSSVPASYLNYLWNHGMKFARNDRVADYIRDNIDELVAEYPTGKWDDGE